MFETQEIEAVLLVQCTLRALDPHSAPFVLDLGGFFEEGSQAKLAQPYRCSLSWSLCLFLRPGRGCHPWQACERKNPAGRCPLLPWPLSLARSRRYLSALVHVAPALALLVSLSTLGHCEIRSRDTQRQEVLLLDRRQRLRELALGPHFEHDHCRKLGHHHEGRRLLRGLLVPPC
jgi:hypothetical protein